MFGVLVTRGQRKGAKNLPFSALLAGAVLKKNAALSILDATKASLDANLKTRRDL